MRMTVWQSKGWSLGRTAVAALLALGITGAASASAETETVDKTVAIGQGGHLIVKNFSGSVQITGSDRADVSVHAVRRAPRERLDRIQLDVSSNGQDVTIEANRRRGGDRKDDENVVETDLTIEVPRQVALQVDVFSSPVTVRGVSAGSHHVKTFSGAITLDQVSGSTDAETFSGSIELTPGAWKGDEQIRCKTFSGDIEVGLPQGASTTVDFNSFSGDLDSKLPLVLRTASKKNIRAELNMAQGGGAHGTLSFNTFSGDVRLR
jgi:DUF4097 and DUF4098 domain-containing protein YvlB